jgi:hypothetical protein
LVRSGPSIQQRGHGLTTAPVSTLLTMTPMFGVDTTDAQQDAIRGLLVVIASLIAALVIRPFVVGQLHH